MDFFRITLTLALLLVALVAGFVFAFSTVVMPGIRTLSDHDHLQAFKVIDGVIQNGQPIFMIVWLGSFVTLVAAVILGYGQLQDLDRLLLFTSLGVYLCGVQIPTAAINVPLNNQLQKQELASMSAEELQTARANFEPRWVRWNTIRTILATVTTVLLICVALRL